MNSNITRRDALKRAAVVMGGVITAPTMMGVLKGCTAKPELAWTPTFFTENQAAIVAEIAEGILPRTDTPGAKELGVPKFMEDLVSQTYDEDRQKAFLSGIDAFNTECKESTGDDFLSLDAEGKASFLKQKNDEILQGGRGSGDQPPFFWMVKELTIVGYFTTEVGATQVLQYKLIPTRYDGCISLEEAGGKTWAMSR